MLVGQKQNPETNAEVFIIAEIIYLVFNIKMVAGFINESALIAEHVMGSKSITAREEM